MDNLKACPEISKIVEAAEIKLSNLVKEWNDALDRALEGAKYDKNTGLWKYQDQSRVDRASYVRAAYQNAATIVADLGQAIDALRRAAPENKPLTLDEVATAIRVVCENGGCPPNKNCVDKQDCHKWYIVVEKQGTAKQSLSTCEEESADIYSDVFEIESEILRHSLIKKVGEYEPVVHGRWIEQSYVDEPVICSNCKSCPAELAYRGGFADEEYKRCPSCGAVMEGRIK